MIKINDVTSVISSPFLRLKTLHPEVQKFLITHVGRTKGTEVSFHDSEVVV